MFLVRPAAAVKQLNTGIPDLHRSFWEKIEVGHLYKCMSVSTAKVLSLLQEPQMDIPSKEEVWLYLQRFIGNMTEKNEVWELNSHELGFSVPNKKGLRKSTF